MTVHDLKIWPEFFQAVKRGDKRFEMRQNDRNYQVGDFLNLHEYDPQKQDFTQEFIVVKVLYVLDKQPFVPKGYVCMSIKLIEQEPMYARVSDCRRDRGYK